MRAAVIVDDAVHRVGLNGDGRASCADRLTGHRFTVAFPDGFSVCPTALVFGVAGSLTATGACRQRGGGTAGAVAFLDWPLGATGLWGRWLDA